MEFDLQLLPSAVSGYREALRHMAGCVRAMGSENRADELLRFADALGLEVDMDVLARVRTGVAAELAHCTREAARPRAQADFLAHTDALTALPNRREFDVQIADRIEKDVQYALLLFDLDGFKALNDRHGHLCGDQILQCIGESLRVQVRSGDFACRWGGDEFVVLLNCDIGIARQRAAQIARSLSASYTVRSGRETFDVLIGVSAGTGERRVGEPPEHAFACADAELYRGKSSRSPRRNAAS